MKRLRKGGFMNAKKLVNLKPYSAIYQWFFIILTITTTDTNMVNQAQL